MSGPVPEIPSCEQSSSRAAPFWQGTSQPCVPLTRVGCYMLCLIPRSETLVASFGRRVGLVPYASPYLSPHGFVLIFDLAPEKVIDAAGTAVNA